MSKYNLHEIPDMDPGEFSGYRAAGRTGEYFAQTVKDGVLDLHHTLGWVPIGKTLHPSILSSGEAPCDIAIMYQWQTSLEEMVWFHLSSQDDSNEI